MDKNDIERMCRNAGLAPAKRDTIDGMDVFIADGFAAQPDVTFKRFGVDKGEFPFGCYATIWWTAYGEDRFDVGRPLLFDAFHDTGQSPEWKRDGRINRAMQDAREFIRQRKTVKLDA